MRILAILQAEARLTTLELAERIPSLADGYCDPRETLAEIAPTFSHGTLLDGRSSPVGFFV